LPELLKQLGLVLGDELQPVNVVSKLIELAERTVQRAIVRGEEGRGYAVELTGGVVLDLAVGLDLALQLDQLLGAIVDLAQALQADDADHNQQHSDGQKRGEQLALHTSRNARDPADQRTRYSHHRSFTRLNRSRRNSSGSKRTPRYCTRSVPCGSIIEVRKLWSTPPFSALLANTP
jgi:hypothetical protein